MAEPGKEKNFRVVIVGGSIAGLTLGHCLQRNGVDFVILEARNNIAPQVGASVGILGNGARILDQLGLFDEILDRVQPVERAFIWTDDGKLLTKTDTPELIHQR